MQTRFDSISDQEIEKAESAILKRESYAGIEPDTLAIADFARQMRYWQAWVSTPVTFFAHSGLHYDGHHRVRAAKYVARRHGIQIQIPVRYDLAMTE